MVIQNWTDAVFLSLQQVWDQVLFFLPSLLGAILVFVIGLIVASGLGHLVEKVLMMSRIDSLLSKTGVPHEFERSGVHFSISRFFGRLTYWFFLVVTLLSAANILLGAGNNVFTTILQPVLAYIPEVVKAVLLLVGTIILANFLRHVVRASVVGARLHASKALASVAWWAVIVTGSMAALAQLGIAVQIINTVIMGVIAMLAIAGGIAFGLGGKDYAAHLLVKFRDQVEGNK